MSVLPAYVYVYNVYALEVKEGNLEGNLCHVGAGNDTRVSWKNSHYSYPLSHLSNPLNFFLR